MIGREIFAALFVGGARHRINRPARNEVVNGAIRGRRTSLDQFGRAIRLALMLICSVTAPTSVVAQSAEEYRLGINDRVRVKIGQWRIVEEVYDSWDGLEGEYVVGPNGALSIALAGSVPAEGLTVQEVAEEISLRVQQRIGIPTPPATSVEIAEFRPVYVIGAVSSPGEFRYRPQMTVLQAVGMAGGYLRSDAPFSDILNATRDFELFGLNRWRLIAQLARLDAELAEAERIESIDKLAGAPNAEELLQIEGTILNARNSANKSKKTSIKELKELLSEKIKSLGKEMELRSKQLKLAREELERQQSLFKRRVVVASHVNQYDQRVSDMEARLLALRVATLTAEQQLNEATRAELDLINERRSNIATESQEAREELDEVEVRLQMTKALMASSLGGGLGGAEDSQEPIHRLIRRADGQTTTLIVDEHYVMRPGDTLQVTTADKPLDSDEEASTDVPQGAK